MRYIVRSFLRLAAAFLLLVALNFFPIVSLTFAESLNNFAGDHPGSRAKEVTLHLPDDPREQAIVYHALSPGDFEEWSRLKELPRSERPFALQDYRDVIGNVLGSPKAISRLAHQTAPLSLLQADFNQDGIPDLVTGSAADEAGVITLRLGLLEALFPKQADWFVNPIIPFGDPIAFSTPVPPVLMASGDFNNDGFVDLVMSDLKSNGIFMMAGDSRRTFHKSEFISLPGRPTAMYSGELGRVDGLKELAIAVEVNGKGTLLIYQSAQGALKGLPSRLDFEGKIVAIEAARIDEDAYTDLALATTSHLMIVYGDEGLLFGSIGSTYIQKVDLGFTPQAIVVGNFFDPQQFHKDLSLLRKETGAMVIHQNLGGRSFRESFNHASISRVNPRASNSLVVVPAQLNGDGLDDLVTFDGKSEMLSILKGSETKGLTAPDSFTTDSPPVAVLPMRLNPTALDVLVVLKANGTLSFMMAPIGAIIAVDTQADDTTTGGTSNGVISLREAILLSNGGTGGDGLTTGLGRALTSGACPGAFETCYISGAFGFGLSDMIVFDDTTFGVAGGTIRIAGPASRRPLPPLRDGATTIDTTVACPGPATVPNCSGILPGSVTLTPLTPVTLGAADDGLSIQTSSNVIRGLNINLFPDNGIEIPLGSGNKIESCKIGVAGGNGGEGIDDTGSSDTIGGAALAQRNIISGNLGNGIIARNAGIVIQGNFIGTDAAGNSALSNGLNGISLLAAATDAIIGGAGKGNTISGNSSNGISIASNNTLVQGNIIGRNSANSADIPNGSDGLNISGRSNTIGGVAAGTANAIRGNFQDGVQLSGTSNLIQGNNVPGATGSFIGGNGRHGIFILGGSNTVGGAASGTGNLILSNAMAGLRIEASSTNVVQGNTIEANGQDGIQLDITSNTNTIGGTGAGNIIDSNGGAGVLVESGTANPILSNSIFSNSGLGIDLGTIGVTANDIGDGDAGPNNLQNFPVLSSAATGSSTIIKGTLNSTANTTFTIEFFSDGVCDASGNGEGQSFIGSATTATNASGNATFSVTIASPVPAGQFITATAIPTTNNTSEFSQCLIVSGCPVISLTSPPLPDGTVGVAYDTTITAAGGSSPYTFAVTSGALPNGLSLSAAGTITGTPDTVGTFNFTVTATDANGCTGNQAYTINVICGTVAIAPASLPAGTVAVAYNQTLTASVGTAPFTFAVTAGSLPNGLTLSTGGAITGVPTTIGTFNFTVTATDNNGCTGNKDYSITINCGTITLSPTTLPAGSVGAAYSQNLSAAGGTAPFSFAVTTGSLPNGLTLSSAGAITGTPTTNGNVSFTVTATDVNGCTGSRAYSINITCPTITVSPPTIPDATEGVAYSQNLSASGGIAPFSFAVSAGSLPNGLTLISGGAITGTPTTLGDFVFTARAMDANGCTGSRAYAINVSCGTVTVSPATLPSGSVGTPYSQNLSAAAGTAPFSFAVTSGNLPDGLTLSSTGALTGTPTTTGSFNFTVTVTDSPGCTGTQDYTIDISCVAISLTAPPLPNAVKGIFYDTTITASGGSSPYSFSVTSGSLPSGITLSPDGTLSGTATVEGSFPFTITATDAGGCFGNQAYTLVVSPFLIDDFEDGIVSWDVTKGTWSEIGGSLIGTGNSKAIAFAPLPWNPSGLSGCTICTIQVDDVVVSANNGGVRILGWYTDNANKVEVIFKDASDKVILRQKVGGNFVVKTKATATLTAGTPFDVEVSFDGTNFNVMVDGSSVLTVPAAATPTGKVGLSIKNGSGTFGEIRVQ